MSAGLNEADLNPDPIAEFEAWFERAQAAGIKEPNAMTLATATREGIPSARVVLFKGLSAGGFVFFTNYDSQKGRELTENPHAALVFYWRELDRQVRVTGSVSRVPREESEHYFHSRARGSQLGAWASRQSTVILGREVLDSELEALDRQYGTDTIPLPPFWGGFRLQPQTIEFWQARPNRLHDRLLYRIGEDNAWSVLRLSP